MKTFLNLMATCLFMVASCNKAQETPNVNPYVSLMNASPTGATFFFYLNGAKATSGALSLGGFVAYQPVSEGTLTVKIQDVLTDNFLLEQSFGVEVNKAYSLFLTGKDEHKEFLLHTDQFPEANTEKAFIRFINLSPDTGPLDLAFADSTSLTTAHPYKAVGDFVILDPGTYSFSIQGQGSGTVNFLLKDQVLKAGKVYSVVALGMNDPGDLDRPFEAVMVNNY